MSRHIPALSGPCPGGSGTKRHKKRLCSANALHSRLFHSDVPGRAVAVAAGGAEEVQPLVAEADGHIIGGDALAVETRDDVRLLGPDADYPGSGAPGHMGELVVLPLGIGTHKFDEGAPADLFTTRVFSTPSSIRASATGMNPPP